MTKSQLVLVSSIIYLIFSGCKAETKTELNKEIPGHANNTPFALTPILTTSNWSLATNAEDLAFDPDVLDKISKYARTTSQNQTENYQESCPSVIAAQKSTKLAAAKDILTFTLNVSFFDEGTCQNGFTGNITEKVYVFYQCVNADFSGFNNISVYDLYQMPEGSVGACIPSGVVNLFSEFSYSIKGELTGQIEGAAGNMQAVKMPWEFTSITKTSSGDKPCVRQINSDGGTEIIECVTKNMLVSLGREEDLNSFAKHIQYQEENINHITNSAKGFSNGKISYRLNNWNGEITFGSLTSNPSYVLNSKTESKRGEILPLQQLSLTTSKKDGARFPPPNFLPRIFK